MNDEKKVTVFFKFKDGFSEYCNIIELKDSSIKIAFPNAQYEYSLHPDRSHMKKINQQNWVEPTEQKRIKYLHITHANYKKFRGVSWLGSQLDLNGLPVIVNIAPTVNDPVLEIEQLSNERLHTYVGHTKEDKKMVEENARRNNISTFLIIPFALQDIVIGIKDESAQEPSFP